MLVPSKQLLAIKTAVLTIEAMDTDDEMRARIRGIGLRLGKGEKVRDGGKALRKVRVQVTRIFAAQCLPLELLPARKGLGVRS